jgi:hypothetical protein
VEGDVGVPLTALFRETEHIGADINTDYGTCISHAVDKLGNVKAGAASDVEDPLTRLRVKRFVH